MNKTLTILAAAIAGTLGATSSQATTYTATLMGDVAYAGDGSRTANITSSSATWSYNDVTGLLSQTGATFNARIDLNLSGFTTMFRHSITGLVIGNGGAASASTFVCVEGNYGPSAGADLCGNYTFGGDFTNNSTVTYGPGTAAARTLGGDDMGLGPQQTIALYNGFSTVSWVGTTLTLSNAVCNRVAPGGSNSCATVGGFNQGYTWTLNAGPQVAFPIPAAAWLFGSALGLLGVARHRAKRG